MFMLRSKYASMGALHCVANDNRHSVAQHITLTASNVVLRFISDRVICAIETLKMYEEGREESIYNLIPVAQSTSGKDSRYKSKFKSSGSTQNGTSQFKAPHKTMGPAKVDTRPPDSFLKKHEKEMKLPENKSFKYPDSDHRKPPVPRVDEKPVMGLHTNKDYITQNAVENIMAVPRKPERKLVDTRNGDKMLLEPSGLEPIFLRKKDFGKTPIYLEKRKEELQRSQEEYDAYVAEHYRRGAMRKLTDEEREALISGLKQNWEHLHQQYLGLSVVIDTTPKMMHKEKLELEMKQLEKDVELLQSHRIIYIAN